jgi:(S)-ureidoglycine aminohydrolase
MDLFGQSRSHVAHDHALIEPGSFVTAPLVGWERTQTVMLIAPVLGARFTQFLAMMEAGGSAAQPANGVERCVYVLEGSLTVQAPSSDQRMLTAGGFGFFPPGDRSVLRAPEACRLNVFEKRYVPREGVAMPVRIVGHERDIKGEPFMNDPAARLHVLLPDEPAFDMAVNVFRFDPGAALPFVEVHIMEHGLLMIAGRGIYRLSDRWYPVQKGDAIWMASYCPQLFVAMGKEPAAYLYYKDVNRHPLGNPP